MWALVAAYTQSASQLTCLMHVLMNSWYLRYLGRTRNVCVCVCESFVALYVRRL